MEKIYVGKIVSTHGIKGEVKIISDNEYKDRIFKIGNSLLVDDKKYKIKSYRHHKIYDMVTLDDYKNINEVQFLLKKKVYVDKSLLKLNSNEVYFEDLISYKVLYNDNLYNVIDAFYASETNKVLRVLINNKEVLIPYNSTMIKKIDKIKKIIEVDLIDGVI